MRSRRDELTAVIVHENGKGWRDADAETCEAIDFCEFYAREAIQLFEEQRLGEYVGEHNALIHEGRGPCAVIAPWNFPLAILCGMSVAALVTGNPVLMKPAEQTMGIARMLFDILREAGAPADVLHFLPGRGETVGVQLVSDPRIALIAFTGSKAVGLNIIKTAGLTNEAQTQVKKVVCEMGGKNAIIVDASADLDEAVLGVRASAFGFKARSAQPVPAALWWMNPDEFGTIYCRNRGPDHWRSSFAEHGCWACHRRGRSRHDSTADRSRQAIRPIGSGMELPEEGLTGGRLVAHVFVTDDPKSKLMQEEIFGPVLGLIRARTSSTRAGVGHDGRYRLTGGVYSRKPAHLTQA